MFLTEFLNWLKVGYENAHSGTCPGIGNRNRRRSRESRIESR